MTPELYAIVLLAVACLILYFGIHLLITKIPQRLESSIYDKSRKLMGVTFIAISLSITLYFIFGINTFQEHFRISYNLICYYIISKLVTQSFIVLIGRKSKMFGLGPIWALGIYMLYPVSLWCVTYFVNSIDVIHALQITAAGILMLTIIWEIMYFFSEYRKVLAQGELFYADDIGVHINWMIKCVYAFMFAGLVSVLMAFSPRIPLAVLFLYVVTFATTCIYVFNRYISFIVIFTRLIERSNDEGLVPQINTAKAQLNPAVSSHIKTQLEEWIAEKGYHDREVSLQSLSMKLYTNRQYLSNYINNTYNCSFRVWISKMRIEDAKKLLMDDSELTLTAVSEQVGFLSSSSFTHAFKSSEGVAPSQWMQNRNKLS